GTKDWRDSAAFRKREELPEPAARSLSAVRTAPVVEKPFYVTGSCRMDHDFLASLVLPEGMRALLYRNLEQGFVSSALTDVTGDVKEADRFEPIIEKIQKQPGALVETLQWTPDPAPAETFHAMPLPRRNNEPLAVSSLRSSPPSLG